MAAERSSGRTAGVRFAERRPRATTAIRLLALLAPLLPLRPAAAADPLSVVRDFCRADGSGARLDASGWKEIAPYVGWRLEPAWDRVLLVAGYEIGSARWSGEDIEVIVTYTVSAEVRGEGIDRKARLEQRRFLLKDADGSQEWIIQGPPPPPHVFASRFDADRIQASLQPGAAGYQSASVLVWMLLRGAGLDFPYLDTRRLADGTELTDVDQAEPGDLVFYYDADEPYQVGILEAEDVIVSATLNAGVRRSPLDAFAGRVAYRRFVQRPPPTARAGSSQGTPPQDAATDG